LQSQDAATQNVAESLLLITGTMGSGKSAVLGEASDILARRGIVHAAIDLDAFGLAHLSSAAGNEELMFKNLRSVYANCLQFGIRRFLLARAIEEKAQLELCREIIPAAHTVVGRLIANVESMKHRVEIRETGTQRQEYIARVAKLDLILDQAHLEDFRVTNENRLLTDVALEMLIRAGWNVG
jgi:hypothetical protein